MTKLYDMLTIRLRQDASRAVCALLSAKQDDGPPVTPGEILAARLDDGRWVARVDRPGSGWLGGHSGDSRPSEVEALCSLVERARHDADAAGGVAPLHLLDRLEHDVEALDAYRAAMGAVVQALLGGPLEAALRALEALDRVAEASDFAAEMAALRALVAREAGAN